MAEGPMEELGHTAVGDTSFGSVEKLPIIRVRGLTVFEIFDLESISGFRQDLVIHGYQRRIRSSSKN